MIIISLHMSIKATIPKVVDLLTTKGSVQFLGRYISDQVTST